MASPSSVPPTPSSDGASKSSSSWPGYALAVLITASATGAVALFLDRPRPQPVVVHPPPTQAPAPTPLPTDTPAPILVFVSGAVQQPGLYSLPGDARVADALNAAGGLSEEAADNAVNQAERLWDGVQVHVPAAQEVAAEPPAGVSGDSRSVGIELDIAGKVHLNSASQEELESLPGIGEVKAEAIIEGRPYASIEELERVTGIGAKTIEQLRDLVDLQ